MKQDEVNQAALDDPQPGDYWHEMFFPYFLVVQVNGAAITVLSCMGGPNSYNRKHEKNARVDNKDGTWQFDYSRYMVVDRAWIKRAVKYDTIDGFVADVVRGSEKFDAVVKEYVNHRTRQLMQEFRALGPAATDCLLQMDFK